MWELLWEDNDLLKHFQEKSYIFFIIDRIRLEIDMNLKSYSKTKLVDFLKRGPIITKWT